MQVNMHKVVIKILQGSVVTQTVLGGQTVGISSGLKLVESRQRYCNENRVQFFWPTLYKCPDITFVRFSREVLTAVAANLLTRPNLCVFADTTSRI